MKSVCDKKTLDNCKVDELKDIAKKSKCVGYSNKKKDELIKLIKKCRKSSSSGSKRKSGSGSKKKSGSGSKKKSGSGDKRKSNSRKTNVKSTCNEKSLDGCKVAELKDIAKKSKCVGYSNKKKDELVKLIKKCRKSSSSGSKRKSGSGDKRKTSSRKTNTKSTCNEKSLDGCKVTELKDIAKKSKCVGYSNKKKDELVKLIKKCRKSSSSGSNSTRKKSSSGSKRKSKKTTKKSTKKSTKKNIKKTDCDINNLEKCSITQLKNIAKSEGCQGYSKYNKDDIKLLINLIKNCIKPKSSNKPATPEVFNPKFKMGEFVIFEGMKGKVGATYKPIIHPFGIKMGHDDEYRYNLYDNHKLIKEKAPESQLKLAES